MAENICAQCRSRPAKRDGLSALSLLVFTHEHAATESRFCFEHDVRKKRIGRALTAARKKSRAADDLPRRQKMKSRGALGTSASASLGPALSTSAAATGAAATTATRSA